GSPIVTIIGLVKPGVGPPRRPSDPRHCGPVIAGPVRTDRDLEPHVSLDTTPRRIKPTALRFSLIKGLGGAQVSPRPITIANYSSDDQESPLF
ncbi:MAG TPA: hypothetical protein VGJ22_14700, partial [Anaerolineales bacterium]